MAQLELGVFSSQLLTLYATKTPLWRVSFTVGGMVAVVCTLSMFFATETPLYLCTTGREEEAYAALQKLRYHCSINEEFEDIKIFAGMIL